MAKSSMSKEYLGISDMMSGLMMVFMFIAVAFMVSVEHQKNEIESVKEMRLSIKKMKLRLKKMKLRLKKMRWQKSLRWRSEVV